ncbi:serine/arginine-rich splicing factor SC35-like [Panicum virgatum]|uniref:RRM domain-containing protein n=1 Tax=Panicum virgatum TaxID=38727 RepID=A0A8T0MZB0_PANVG|nr:serine/arginine-rich splicing factor SC35-like [Panicum virgatum]KAG2540344.1 hypothetical protein PVAP13_9NG549900 [Panicum virgatum]
MSHFRRSGAPENRDSFSLLVLNVSFRTTADDLFPVFDRYGDVVDIFIPRDRRTGDSRGFAFVRYNYEDEAQKAVDGLDGRKVDGRVIMVQFAKYGPNAQKIHRGRITEETSKPRGHFRSRSPRWRYQNDYRDRDYRKQSRSRSRERYEQERYRDNHYRRRSGIRSISPDYDRKHTRYSRSPARRSPGHGKSHSPRMAPSREVTPSRPRDSHSPRSGCP